MNCYIPAVSIPIIWLRCSIITTEHLKTPELCQDNINSLKVGEDIHKKEVSFVSFPTTVLAGEKTRPERKRDKATVTKILILMCGGEGIRREKATPGVETRPGSSKRELWHTSIKHFF